MMPKLGFRTWTVRPLVGQLADLGLKPQDIDYVAFAHVHFDHVGNANLFTRDVRSSLRVRTRSTAHAPVP